MVIGIVLSSPPGYSETFFRNKIRFLEEKGIKVIVFVDKITNIKANYDLVEGFSWNGNWLQKTIKLIQAFLRLLLSPARAVKLYNLNRKSGFAKRENVLSLLSSAHILRFKLGWIHFGFATTALKRENIAKVMNTKMAVSIRGYDIATYPLRHPNCYQLLWQRLNKLHYISDDLFLLAQKQGFNLKTPNQKITPAIDTTLFQGRERFSFSNPLRIVTIARLNWKKGLEYTLESLSILNQKAIDFEYTVIGEGEDYERLIFASYQLGIKEKIHFVGKKKPEEIKQFLSNSDIYLQYSIQEGFCNSVLEAQSMGLLCIVSNAEGLPENVSHEQTGWVVPKRNPVVLAEQILKVMKLPPSKKAEISQAAMKRVKEQFNLEKQKQQFIKLYQS